MSEMGGSMMSEMNDRTTTVNAAAKLVECYYLIKLDASESRSLTSAQQQPQVHCPGERNR